MSSKNGGEHYDLEEQISRLNLFELQKLYIDKQKEYVQECVKYLDFDIETKEGKLQYSMCDHVKIEVVKVAIAIANRLTGIK